MKILQWCVPLFSEGGRGEFVIDLAQALARAGHEIYVVHESTSLSPTGTRNRLPGMSTMQIDLGSREDPPSQQTLSQTLTRLDSFISSQDPEIIHAHRWGDRDTALLSVVARSHGIPVVYTEHEHPDLDLGYFRDTRGTVSSLCQAVIFPAVHSMRAWDGLFPASPPITTIVNGVTGAPPAPEGVDPEAVFFSGRHSDEKGLSTLISAWPAVLARKPQARLLIAGAGNETSHLQHFARELAIDHSIDWLGWLDRETNRIMAAQCQLIVVPSLWQEPFGLVAAEASLASRPVVASRVGGLIDIVRDGVTGILVEPGDKEALSHAMIRLLDDPALADGFGRAGAEWVEQEFSMTQCASRHSALYQQVCHARVTATRWGDT